MLKTNQIEQNDQSQFLESLKTSAQWNKIILLNYTPSCLLKDKSVVRFRGMIQDMLDPEIFMEKYTVKNSVNGIDEVRCGKFHDHLNLKPGELIDYDSPSNVLSERRTFCVISIPGLNEWVSTYEIKFNKLNEAKTIQNDNRNYESNVKRLKRSSADSNEVSEMDIHDASSNYNNNDRNLHKRVFSPDQNLVNVVPLNEHLLNNSPIKDRPSMACMVKIYENFDTYSLNSIIDVVGILTHNPNVDSGPTNEEANGWSAETSLTSSFPRLHAVSVHVLSHTNPLIDERFLNIEHEKEYNMLSVYQDLRKLFSLCLFNDDLAADYLILHLISSVYNRSEMLSIGKFALNLCNLPENIPTEYTSLLYQVLQMLLPASYYLAMNLNNMNSIEFVPRKDYNKNRIIAGLLQLAPSTHLVLDETKMQVGQLKENGVLGMQSLGHLITQQQIKCNFQYYDIDYNTDIPVLVFSEGKSLLPNDFAMPLQADAQSVSIIYESLKAAHHYLQQNDRLNRFRRFLTKARISSFNMIPANNEIVQNDFVKFQKENLIRTADDFHSLLVLSRLLGIVHGKTDFDTDLWEKAKTMESLRHKRLQANLNKKRSNT